MSRIPGEARRLVRNFLSVLEDVKILEDGGWGGEVACIRESAVSALRGFVSMFFPVGEREEVLEVLLRDLVVQDPR